jgi:very-short-patch-repair endonuclease
MQQLKENARYLRKTQTEAEGHLWYQLRNRHFSRYRFRRQHTLGHYIVDFVCLHRRLIIELDGSQHIEQKDYDEQRTAYLLSRGFRVIRFWNHDIFENTDAVLEEIYRALSLDPHPVPLPQ